MANLITVVYSDILNERVDAIVNPANSYMLHGGGLAGLIAQRAGPAIVKESRTHVREHGMVPTGRAILTGPGELENCKALIHTVGPVWQSDGSEPYWRQNSSDEDPDELLARAHFAAIKLAWENNLRSVAFPAVSCGVFRFPVERAAPIAVSAVQKALREYSPPVEKIVFCLLDDSHYAAFAEALEQILE